MKTAIFAVITTIITLSTQHVTAQTKPGNVKTEQEIITMLCRKWKITHLESQGQRFPVPPEIGASYVTFHTDGSLTEVEEGNTFRGRWSYDHKTMTLKTDDKDGTESHKIISITNERLIIKGSFEGMSMDMIMTSA